LRSGLPITDRVFFFITCLINQSECVLSLLAAFANWLESLRLQLMFFTTKHTKDTKFGR
jgi:hypothetical protein